MKERKLRAQEPEELDFFLRAEENVWGEGYRDRLVVGTIFLAAAQMDLKEQT